MRAALFVLVAVVIGLVSCGPSPALRAKIQARLAQLKVKRGPAEPQGPGPEPFPFEMMVFLSLIGKCEVNRRVQELLGEDQSEEGILAAACPAVMDIAVDMLESNDEEIRDAEAFVKKHLPVFVCSNLKAETENIEVLVNDAGEDPEEDTYLKISTDFAEICDDVLGNIEAEFIPDLEKLHATVSKKR